MQIFHVLYATKCLKKIKIENDSVQIQWHTIGLTISNAKHINIIIFQIKHTEAILSNSTRKLVWYEIGKMLMAVFINKLIVLFIIVFGTLSFSSLLLKTFLHLCRSWNLWVEKRIGRTS